MNIRIATPEDAFAIQNIYRYYVDNTAITFELEVPSVKEFQERITKTLERYPYLVAEEEGEVIAYAYAGIFYDRRAYDWSAEMSVYVQRGIHGKGVGTALYEKMEELLKKQNIVNLFACITHPNAESEAFHAARGYEKKAHFEQCGYKLGKWWDIVWMQKVIASNEGTPEPFQRFTGVLPVLLSSTPVLLLISGYIFPFLILLLQAYSLFLLSILPIFLYFLFV